jgi:hypothetical protein
LQWRQVKDDALLQAMKRYCEYRSAADSMEGPDTLMLVLKLVCGFATTLLATVAAAVLPPGQMVKILHGEFSLDDVPVAIVALCFSVVLLPGILSIVMSLQQDYNFGPKVLALRYAAALVEREMFRYRACAEYYSDEAIIKKGEKVVKEVKAAPTAKEEKKLLKKTVKSVLGKLTRLASFRPKKGDGALAELRSSPVAEEEPAGGQGGATIKGDKTGAAAGAVSPGSAEPEKEEGKKKKDKKHKEKRKDASDVDRSNYDMLSTRARRMTEELIKIGMQVPPFDCPDVSEGEPVGLIRKLFVRKGGKGPAGQGKRKKASYMDVHALIERMKGLKGVREVAEYNLEDLESEERYGQLSGEDYAELRLNAHRKRFEEEADRSSDDLDGEFDAVRFVVMREG